MREIPLSRGRVGMVDDADYGWVSAHKWCVGGAQAAYVMRAVYDHGRHVKNVLLHREILGAPAGVPVDHIDGNPLNNQRANLRLCDSIGNARNRRKRGGCVSQFKGVVLATWPNGRAKWKAQINVAGRTVFVGYFDKEIDAALAYDAAARDRFGAFACVNFAGPGERCAGSAA